MKIYKFSAAWCGPCQHLAKQLEGTSLPIYPIDVDDEESESLISAFNIKSVPTLVFVDDSDKELARLHGAVSVQTITDKYNELNQ